MTTLDSIPFVKPLEDIGGKVYLVGGIVRDTFFLERSKDIDLVVTGIEKEKLHKVLQTFGKVDAVGASFGIFVVSLPGRSTKIDVALPRTEIKTGEGHRGFEIVADHTLDIVEDLKRRDFTMNAMAIGTDGILIDPFNGELAIQENTIDAVSLDTFRDDPLRIMRAYQFSARFGMEIGKETRAEILLHKESLREITGERISEEIRKLVKPNSRRVVTVIKQMQEDGIIDQLVISAVHTNRSQYRYVGSIAEFFFYLTLTQPCIEYVVERFKLSTEEKIELEALTAVAYYPSTMNIYKHGLKYPKIYKTMFFDDNVYVKTRIGKFKDLPKTQKEFNITSQQLIEMGYEGKRLGEVYEFIREGVLHRTIPNETSAIIEYVRVHSRV